MKTVDVIFESGRNEQLVATCTTMAHAKEEAFREYKRRGGLETVLSEFKRSFNKGGHQKADFPGLGFSIILVTNRL